VKQFFITVLGVFVGLFLFLVVLPVLLILSAAGSAGAAPPTPGRTVLVMDLRQPVSDQPPLSPFASLTASLSVVDVVRKLEAAEDDSRVKGLFIRAPEMGLAPAHAEEIRQAIIDFQASGKFVVAHAQGFFAPTITNYVAVAAADELWLQGSSDFAATGLSAETLFLGGLFERFGITAEFEQFYEFKNAANSYLERDYTDAHRTAETGLLTSIYNAGLAAVAVDRSMPVERMKELLDSAPMPASEAVAGKLADRTGMPEEALEAALERAGGVDSAEALDLASYTPGTSSGPTIALVSGEGPILGGPDVSDPFSGAVQINGDAIAAALREATDNEDVKAIVFRVSSPGGSPLASEQIWAAVERAQGLGKPVVISMGAYAASGGYYVAAGADRIVAMPSTITGSIGVFAGKFAVDQALNRYTGANLSTISVGGPFASAYDAGDPMSNSQREEQRASLERTYLDFTGKVAEGRKLAPARVQELARGRVWTGAQARPLGLVDVVGGLRRAIAEAKGLAGIEAGSGVTLVSYPAPEDPFAALSGLFGTSAPAARAAAVLGTLVGDERLGYLIQQARRPEQVHALEPVRVR
jgi:protease IV